LTAGEGRQQDDMIGRPNRLDNQIGALAGARALTADQRGRLDGLKDQRLELEGRLAQLEAELVRKYEVAAGAVYPLDRIRALVPADTALVGWLDLEAVPGADDPPGDHWAGVGPGRGALPRVRIVGTGTDGAWTNDDGQRSGLVRQLLRGGDRLAWREAVEALASQRLGPLEPALAAVDGLPAVRHLVVLPSPALAGIPLESMVE